MQQISIAFSQPQLKWLRTEAERLGITLSELVRRILDAAREQKT